jgi:hypothetical protein
MLMSKRAIRQYIVESPGIRTLFSAVFPILAGVLSGTFVLEITTSSGLAWGVFYRTRSFYALSVLSLVIYLYNRELYLFEREVSRFLDSNYCIAYMRSKCLPEAAERYKELIRNGGGGELTQAMDELRKILR